MSTDQRSDEAETHPAQFHLQDIAVSEVSFVKRGASGHNRWVIAKAEEPAPEPPMAAEAAPEPAPAVEVVEAAPSEPVAKDEPPVEAAPVESPAPAPEPAPVVGAAAVEPDAPEVEKGATRSRIDLNRKVWDLIHREIDKILADGESEPAAEVVEVVAETAAPVVSTTPATKSQDPLPENVMKALEALPALVAKVQEQDAAIARLTKERVGSQALVAETPAGAAAAVVKGEPDCWYQVGADICELARREIQDRKRR